MYKALSTSSCRISFPERIPYFFLLATDHLSEVLTASRAQKPFYSCLHYYKKTKIQEKHGQRPMANTLALGLGDKE